MAASLPAALVFGAIERDDATWYTFALAALATSVVFAIVDLVLFVAFERVRRGTWSRVVAREGLFYDCLSVPLGLVGALAGWIATEVDWWVAGLVLLPVPFVPELLLVRARQALGRRSLARHARGALPTFLVATGLLAGVALALPLPSAAFIAGITAVAVLAGAEFAVDRRRPVAAMGATVVVAGAVVGGTAALAGSAVAAIVATATAVVVSGASLWWAPVAAGSAALASAALFDAHPTLAVALATGIVYQLVVLSRPSRVVWTAPVVAAAVALASAWRALHGAGAFVFAVGLAAIVTSAAHFGAPPWPSRVIAAWSRRATRRVHRAIVVASGVLALALATLAVAVASAPGRAALAAAAAACACGGAAMAMFGVRQWRFAPAARVRDATVVIGCTVALLLGYLPLALDRHPWSLAIIAVSVVLSSAVAWMPARHAEAATTRLPVADREPARPR
jgi:hypothetical protein